MAGPNSTRGFTLVELLVVITIIGLLVALLLPAVQSAREAGRKNTCLSNMRNCGLALLQFEGNKKGFPGYSNLMRVGSPAYAGPPPAATGPIRVSWVAPILPLLERNDIYQILQNPHADITPAKSPLAVLQCPSHPASAASSNPLSFVVNTGLALNGMVNVPSPLPTAPNSASTSVSPQYNEDLNSGVFFNYTNWDGNGFPKPLAKRGLKATLQFISTNDGSTYTLMLSENLQAGNWLTDPTTADPHITWCYWSDYSLRQNTGFVWTSTGIRNNTLAGNSVTSLNFNGAALGINGLARTISGPPLLRFDTTLPAVSASGLSFARPSSNHPGGVNACFCGGNGRFIAEDIDYQVYTQLMTPNQNAVLIVPGSHPKTPLNQGWDYILKESDF